MSDDDFSDANSAFIDKVVRLERKYFDALHVNDVPENAVYAISDGNTASVRDVSCFECDYFHPTNVMPDRPFSGFFETDYFMAATEISAALESDSFRADHIPCLQHKATGEVFLTFCTQALRDAFLESLFVVSTRPGRPFVPNTAKRNLTFLTVCHAPYELPGPCYQ